jgi:hypothetical protein
VIYGLNFNGQPIPAAAKFPKYLKRSKVTGMLYSANVNGSCDFILQGVCNTESEVEAMIQQASNGHRRFHIAGPKRAGGHTYWAVYCG